MDKRLLTLVVAITMCGLLLAGGRDKRTLRFPTNQGMIVTPEHWENRDEVRTVIYGDVDYVPAWTFSNLPNLEEIIFDGMVGHIDGYVITNCPKLKRVIFRGPISSTGGSQFVKDCPELKEVVFEGLVFASGYGEPINCPKLTSYTQHGMALFANSDIFRTYTYRDVASNRRMLKQARQLMDYKIRSLTLPSLKFLKSIELSTFYYSDSLAMAIGDTAFSKTVGPTLQPLIQDMNLTKLELLKRSPAYATDSVQINWTYAAPSDSLLALDRQYFNLDSIAGNGDDVSRIKNLMYWVHDAVRHDGSSFNPGSQSLIDLYEICRRENRGVNCRMMAIMLTEALLAEGIPARYLTCQPKLWEMDSDCHVICIAWAESLGKWVWVDPTFAAFVTDENGLMLHPGEVRERLIANKPLILNADANWNHEQMQTKEYYLDDYMAKNLYYIEAITANRPRPEGKESGRSTYVQLIPQGTNDMAPHTTVNTTDPVRFWAAPMR